MIDTNGVRNAMRPDKIAAIFRPIVSAASLKSTVYAVDELNEAAQLALLTRNLNPNRVTDEQ
ncbi:MAG: hypothetical protein QM488_10320 [Rhizobiaceae bacterium]